MNHADAQYLGLCRHILDNGVEKSDRTGTGTLSTFGHQLRFDLAEGFPLLTTKKVAWKSVVHELLWFLRGDTNVKYLRDNGVTIWDDWRRPYSFDRELVFISPRKRDYVPYEGDYRYKGSEIPGGSVDEKLANAWVKMMRRCYDQSSHNYKYYGGRGASVAKEWHDPSVFIEQVKRIPHWWYKSNNWNSFELDKDYYGSNQYGPTTSVWMHTAENNSYTSAARPVRIKDSDGNTFTFVSASEAARGIGMSESSLFRFLKVGKPTVMKGNNKAFIGWEFADLEPNGTLLRKKLIEDGDLGPIYSGQWRSWKSPNGHIDQIAQVIEQIRTNPDSRRLLVNAWNVGELAEMALPPCHFAFQFYVANGRLSCQLYQRSADVFLGLPFNIASYSLLTLMIAHVTGLKPGEFIHTIGDAHIYTNHIAQVKTQLERTPRALPTVSITKDTDDIDAITADDIVLTGYDPHPKLTGKVAV